MPLSPGGAASCGLGPGPPRPPGPLASGVRCRPALASALRLRPASGPSRTKKVFCSKQVFNKTAFLFGLGLAWARLRFPAPLWVRVAGASPRPSGSRGLGAASAPSRVCGSRPWLPPVRFSGAPAPSGRFSLRSGAPDRRGDRLPLVLPWGSPLAAAPPCGGLPGKDETCQTVSVLTKISECAILDIVLCARVLTRA